MLKLRRAVAWICEMALGALLLAIALHSLVGRFPFRAPATMFESIFRYWVTILVVFMLGSGFLITAAAAELILRGKRLWSYPLTVGALFAIHMQFFATGWTSSQKVPIQIAGAIILIAITTCGSLLLGKLASRS